MNKNKLLILIILVLALTPLIIFADDLEETGCPKGQVCINNPLGPRSPDVNAMIGNIINGVLGVVGSLALAMFIYGGITWMTASGSKERVEKGKNILIWATLGLIVIFSAYTVVYFVLKEVLG